MVLGAQLTVDKSLHPIVLLLGFERHKVHAALPGNQSIDVFNDNDIDLNINDLDSNIST